MREVLLTSSALIPALLAVRMGFRKKISRRVQYALWGLVLLRLLIPANLPAVNFSLLSVSEPARTQVAERLEKKPVYVLPVQRQEVPASSETQPDPTVILPFEGRYAEITSEKGQPAVLTSYAFTLEEALDLVWKTGMAVMALWLLASNLRFWMKLRRERIPLDLPECGYPVYLVEAGLVSPCLFGLLRPAVYLTPAALESGESLRHVLAHEETHARHLDPLWSLLRSVCLAVYWFDPLVWWAAAASKEDCELACDEGALRRLGADERIPYGQTLLRLIPVRRSVGGVLVAATTMTSDKKRLKERITRIAENRKMKAAALYAALAVTAAVCAVTFTGCAAAEVPLEAPATPAAPVNAVESAGPLLTIPLTDLSPYEPVKVETVSSDALFPEHHGEEHGEHRQNRQRTGGGCRTTENCGTFAWNYGGNTYVSSHDLRLSSYPDSYFLTFPEQKYREEPFTGLFGYDGVRISYFAETSSGYYCTFNDYYVFTGDPEGGANVFLLARVYGQPQLIDLDGNGTLELASSDNGQNAKIIFQRDGQLFEADLGSLLREYWPEADYTEFYNWDTAGRYLNLWSFVPAEGNAELPVTAWRRLYFDGESLLLYPWQRDLAKHMTTDIRAPAAVVEAAREAAGMELEDLQDNAYEEGPVWDDYCVIGLHPVYPTAEDQLPEGLNLAVYSLHFELHTSTPERVVLAGGVYVSEDGWVGGFGTDSVGYLVFQIQEDGSYVYLGSLSAEADAGSPAFVEWTNDILADHSLPQITVIY